jgi:LAO/AO transport system kinase
VGPALNLADDRRPGPRALALELLERVEQGLPFPGAPRVGITGTPGSGKSTLLDALVRCYRRRGETLGIAAVDPSSRRTGGALLGDRIRVRSGAADPGVFLRSMASRTRLGGLADATRAAVVVLAAAFDRVLVETVGVGQSEGEVATLVDTLVLVVNPGSGDELQFMKAGILELPDLFLVNKADLGAPAQRTAAELASGLGLGEGPRDGAPPPVLLASARDGTGVEALVAAIDAHRAALAGSSELRLRRRRGCEAHVQDALERRYGSHGLECLGGREALRRRLAREEDGSAFGLVARLGREIEEALRKGQGV